MSARHERATKARVLRTVLWLRQPLRSQHAGQFRRCCPPGRDVASNERFHEGTPELGFPRESIIWRFHGSGVKKWTRTVEKPSQSWS
jgi:hypothetical protein